MTNILGIDVAAEPQHLETVATSHTGDVVSERSIPIDQQLGSFS